MPGFDINRLNGGLEKALVTPKNKLSFKEIDPAVSQTSTQKGDQTVILGSDDNINVVNSELLKESDVQNAVLFVEKDGVLQATDNALKAAVADTNGDGKISDNDGFSNLSDALDFINKKDNTKDLKSIVMGSDNKFYVFKTGSEKTLQALGVKDSAIVTQTKLKTENILNSSMLIEQLKKNQISNNELEGIAKLITDNGALTSGGKAFLYEIMDKAGPEFRNGLINMFNNKNNFNGPFLKPAYMSLLNSMTGCAQFETSSSKCQMTNFLKNFLSSEDFKAMMLQDTSAATFKDIILNDMPRSFKTISIDSIMTNIMATGSGARFLSKIILEPEASGKPYYPKVVKTLRDFATEGNKNNQVIFNIFSDPGLGFLDAKTAKLTPTGKSFWNIITKDNPKVADMLKNETTFGVNVNLKTSSGRNQLLSSLAKGNDGLMDVFFDKSGTVTAQGQEFIDKLAKAKADGAVSNPDTSGAILLFNLLNQKGSTFRDTNGKLTANGDLMVKGMKQLGHTEYINTMDTLNQVDMPKKLDPKMEDKFVKDNKEKMIKIIDKVGYYENAKYKESIAEGLLRAGYKYHIDPRLLAAQLTRESIGFQLKITSPAGAMGISQFMPATARAYGVKFYNQGPEGSRTSNPLTHIKTATMGAAHMLRDNIDPLVRAGFSEADATLMALNAYNGGSGAFDNVGNKRLDYFADTVNAAKASGTKAVFPNNPKAGLLYPLVKAYNEKGSLPDSFYEVNKNTKISETRWYSGFITQNLLNALADDNLKLDFPDPMY